MTKRNIKRLERSAASREPDRPILVLEPIDYDNDQEYYVATDPDQHYTRDQFDELEQRYILLVVKYGDWPH